jgi:hypothetical protein
MLNPTELKDAWQRDWFNANPVAIGAATGSWADDPVHVSTALHMRPLDQREDIEQLQPKKIYRL